MVVESKTRVKVKLTWSADASGIILTGGDQKVALIVAIINF